MDFVTLQNRVIDSRFDETHRAQVKEWLNYRYGRIWSSEPWSFKIAYVDVAIPAAGSSVTLAAEGIQRIHALWDAETSPGYGSMDALRPEEFHGTSSRVSSIPYGFTVAGNTIYLDKPSAMQRDFVAVAELAFTELVNDSDVPLLPAEYHYLIAQAAYSEGLRKNGDLRWEAEEAGYQAGLADMRAAYLTAVRTHSSAYPAWP